jgi:hypothetical protein
MQLPHTRQVGPMRLCRPAPRISVRNREEDDPLLLHLLVLVEEGEPSRWQRHLRPVRTERCPGGQQDQRVPLIADARDHASAARLDGLSELDQAIHVVVDAGKVRGIHDGLRARCRDMDIGRKHLSRRVPIVMAPCLRVRAGKCDSR